MITDISKAELIQLIEQTVCRVLAEQQQVPVQNELQQQWVSGNELCTSLGVTRQTLSNWYKRSDIKKELEILCS